MWDFSVLKCSEMQELEQKRRDWSHMQGATAIVIIFTADCMYLGIRNFVCMYADHEYAYESFTKY